MVRLFIGTVAFALFAMSGQSALADEKKAPELSGTWIREAGGFELTFAFVKDTLTMTVMNGDNGVVVTSTYTVAKDGSVDAKLTKVEEKGSFPAKPPVGLKISFKWKADGKKATLSDLTGEGAEEAKGILEGEFEAKKK